MAGRGTDILLGGNPVFLTNSLVRQFFENEKNVDISCSIDKEKFKLHTLIY